MCQQEGVMEDWTNKYRVVKTLKENGTTGVYLAEHVTLERFCVIKTLNTGHAQGDAILKEALSLKQLAHPGIPKIYDIEEGEERHSRTYGFVHFHESIYFRMREPYREV